MADEGFTNPTPLPPSPKGWYVSAIEKICTNVTSGATPLRSNSDFFSGGTYSWFKTQELRDAALYESDEKITAKTLQATAVKLFPRDTVLMAMYGDGKTITSLGILMKEAATNQACCAMMPHPGKCDPRFLFYALKHHRSDFIQIASGGAQRNLSGKLIRMFALNVPPLPEQRAIAHILRTLDDKIELNRRMNETLEEMARALFQSWFNDFDPVRRNAARKQNQPSPRSSPSGRGRDEEGEIRRPSNEQLLNTPDAVLSTLQEFLHPSPPGRRAGDEGGSESSAFDHLFPDSFEDSELGEIPRGWDVRPLSELTLVITKGTTPTQGDVDASPDSATQVNYVRVNTIDEDGAILFDKLTAIPESVHLGVLKRSILRADDVLYTIAGTIGRTSIVEESLLPANTNQAVAILRPKPRIPSDFMVLMLRQPAFREELHSNIVHAVQANLSLGMLSKMRVTIPPLDKLEDVFRPIGDMTAQVRCNRSQSRTLAALRDALLPKLISGELRVKDAERFLEGVV